MAVALESSFLGFFAHAGFVNALLDSGVRPAKVSGSSSGALVAAAYACGLEREELRDFVLDGKLQRSFREWRTVLRCPAVFVAYLGHGIVSGGGAVRHLRSALPVQRVEDAANAELCIGVTNVTRRRRQLVTEGDLAAFLVASCAATPVIRSQEIDGEHFVDGGFTDIAPFTQWIDDDEVETIIIHRIVPDRPRVKKWTKWGNFISCWGSTHAVVTAELQAVRIAQAEAAGKRVIVHETRTPPAGLVVSSRRAGENYRAAYQTWQSSPCLPTP